MQTNVPPANKNIIPLQGDPRLIYTAKHDGMDIGFQRSPHSHDFLEILYITRGDNIIEIGNIKYPVERGDIVVYNRGKVHNENIANGICFRYCCAGTGIFVPGLEKDCLIPDNICPVIHTNEYSSIIQDIFSAIFESSINKIPRANEISNFLYSALLNYIIMLGNDGKHASSSLPVAKHLSKSELLAERIKEYVDEKGTKNFSVSDISFKFNVSDSYLARIFKKAYGCTLSTYVIRRQMGEAQSLLLTTNMSMNEIAKRLGYENQSYFSKIFLKTVGLSPLRYRKVNKQ